MPHGDEIRLNSDFSELLEAFNAAGVEYLLIGGMAFGFHAEPRYTKDLDLWIRPTRENADRAFAALRTFGAPLAGVSPSDLIDPTSYFAMGVPPNRIDVLNAIEGIDFERAWPHRVQGQYGPIPMWVIGVDDLIVNKRATGRPRDILDADALERLRDS
jgi:hypothetical protein